MPAADRRVALVTGSSRGLGAVIARRLAQDGFTVAVNGCRGDGRQNRSPAPSAATAAWPRPSAPISPMSGRSPSLSRRSPAGSARWMCWCSTPPARSPKPRSPRWAGPATWPSWTSSSRARCCSAGRCCPRWQPGDMAASCTSTHRPAHRRRRRPQPRQLTTGQPRLKPGRPGHLPRPLSARPRSTGLLSRRALTSRPLIVDHPGQPSCGGAGCPGDDLGEPLGAGEMPAAVERGAGESAC